MPIEVEKQISLGLLVCPKTRPPLTVRDGSPITPDGGRSYRYSNGVPSLIDGETQTS